MTGAFVVNLTRRPASAGISGGVMGRTLDKEIEGAGKDRLRRSPEDRRVSRKLMIEHCGILTRNAPLLA